MTTKLYTVAVPELHFADELQIKRLRKKHDPNFTKIAAHLTLAFGTDHLPEREYLDHIETCVKSLSSCTIYLDGALAVQSHTEANTHHVFLTVSEDAPLHVMHDRLYQGPMESALRRDIPFIPHVTIGQFAHADSAEPVAAWLNRFDFRFEATIRQLSVYADADGPYRLIARFDL